MSAAIRSEAERVTELAKLRSDCARELDELSSTQRADRARLEGTLAARITTTERTAAAERDASAKAIAADLQHRLYAAAARFGKSPREGAIDVVRVWHELAERSKRELGRELAYQHLGLAFAFANGGDLERAGDPMFWSRVGETVGIAVEALSQGAGAAAVEEKLKQVEIAVEAALPRSRPFPDRLDLRRTAVTQADLHAALHPPTA